MGRCDRDALDAGALARFDCSDCVAHRSIRLQRINKTTAKSGYKLNDSECVTLLRSTCSKQPVLMSNSVPQPLAPQLQ